MDLGLNISVSYFYFSWCFKFNDLKGGSEIVI